MSVYKVLVCGGRKFHDQDLLETVLWAYHFKRSFSHLIHGGANGADTLADEWARRHGIQPVRCPANWRRFPKAAGPIRNRAMLQLDPDLVIAFPGGRGTDDMVSLANLNGIEVVKAQ